MKVSTKAALRTWLDLLTVSNAVKKMVDTKLRSQFGISISRFDILATLARAGPDGLRAGDLSQRLLVTEGNITQVTTPLIRDGFVKRRKCSDDGRVAFFQLTPNGSEFFERMADNHHNWIESVFCGLSKNDMTLLQQVLGKIQVSTNDEGKDTA